MVVFQFSYHVALHVAMEALEEVGFSDYAYVDVLGPYAEDVLEDPGSTLGQVAQDESQSSNLKYSPTQGCVDCHVTTYHSLHMFALNK